MVPQIRVKILGKMKPVLLMFLNHRVQSKSHHDPELPVPLLDDK